jgi:hypothetical protein
MDCMGVGLSTVLAQVASSSASTSAKLAVPICDRRFEERREPVGDLSLFVSLQIFHDSVDDASSSDKVLDAESGMLRLRPTEDTAML